MVTKAVGQWPDVFLYSRAQGKDGTLSDMHGTEICLS